MSGTIIANGPGLTDLASRINTEHAAVETSFRNGFEHAVECGRLLIEAKAKIPHGAWLPWLAMSCTVSKRTVQVYMQLAKETPRLGSNAQHVAHFSLRQAIASVSRQVTTTAKLPAPVVTKALEESGDPAIQGALKRAESGQQRHRAREQEAQRAKDNEPAPTFIPMPMREPTAEEIARDEALADLLSRLRKGLRAWMMENASISTDLICDTINAVYCEVQDGSLLDGADAAP